MDKIVDHLFVFDGEGKITDFPGNYTIYRNKQLQDEENEKAKAQNQAKKKENEKAPIKNDSNSGQKKKLTFNEKREFESLEAEIARLETEKEMLETALNSGTLPHDELYQQSERLVEIKVQIDEKELRWLELSELI
jgi:ATP-binding cassette subfamily F protein uup